VTPPVRRAVFALLVLVSLALFLLPVTPSSAPGSDKVGHVAIFAALALAGRWAGLATVPLALGLTAYAVVTELLQATLPLGRLGDPADAVADVAGIALGLVLAWAVTAFRPARRAAPSLGRPRG
jgi:VanZ family protein